MSGRLFSVLSPRMARVFLVVLLAGALITTSSLSASETPAGSSQPSLSRLVISQFKITSSSGQFFLLYNSGSQAVDMNSVQLEYFNNYDLAQSTSSKLIKLSGTLAAKSYYAVNDGLISPCSQMTVNSVSLGFSSTAGMAQIIRLSQAGGVGTPVFHTIDDFVAWSNSSKNLPVGVQLMPSQPSSLLVRQPTDTQGNPIILAAGMGTWLSAQSDADNPCKLMTIGTSPAQINSATNQGAQLLAANPPPAVAGTATTNYANLPASNAGLMAPQISEILPNPALPQTDAADEFIELYNPNDKPLDLSGLMLRAGVSTFYDFTFPEGQFSLQPREFRAFYARQTNLSLANDGGQVKLLDINGNDLAKSDIYSAAKDNQAWVLADGLWQWTTTPTPNAANIITSPPVSKKTSAASAASTKKAKVKDSKTATSKKSPASASASSLPPADKTSSLHPMVLAGVGALALLYACYEYRHDLANTLHRFRRHRTTRGFNRPAA